MSDPIEPGAEEESEWARVWNGRSAAIAKLLGEPEDRVFHALMPFQLGGTADVVPFRNYVPGVTYVTMELTGEDVGQQRSSLGNYELMLCAKEELKAGANLIALLARYTCDAVLEAGHTMDIRDSLGDASMNGLLFANPGEGPMQFELFGEKCGLLLCMGITSAELAWGQEHGTQALLGLLKKHGVFPYTEPFRKSVPLPGRGWVSRMFGR